MPKKSRRRGNRNKWSRANILNYIASGILGLSMLLGSIFVFGGVGGPSSASTGPTPTPIVATITPTSAVGAGPTVTPAP
ncbi:MAG: hypothetical protein ACM3JD_15950 [Rudaea sp.]